MAIQPPNQVYAFQIANTLTIMVKGEEEGYTNMNVVQSMSEVFPPSFYVKGDTTDAIGIFPYEIQNIFTFDTKLDYINITTVYGSTVPVQQIVNTKKIITT